ncbi:DNA-helicase Pif1-like [Sesbania bispinosa]|nr:DNA-helicase Pif1-like [Sesbania bispinosa]
MFLAWMSANSKFPDGRHLTYSEYPTLFIYDVEDAEWKPRKRGFSIGHMNFIPPSVGELYYLRLLLNVQRGCTNYEALCTVNGQLYPTFRNACGSLGLLDDDKEFIDGIIKASKTTSSSYLRSLFVSLLMSNTMSKPSVVWEHTWSLLADDILYAKGQALNLPENMRLKVADSSIPSEVVNEFANWVLAIGNGEVGNLVDDETEVEIPPNMLISGECDPIQDIVNFTYPNIRDHFGHYSFFQDKVCNVHGRR